MRKDEKAMSADFVMLGFQSQLDTGAAKKFQTCFLPLIKTACHGFTLITNDLQ